MKYQITYTAEAENGIEKLVSSGNTAVLKKLKILFNELEEHPRTGIGKPERMKYQTTERWSRRITDKHRLIYDIFENVVVIEVLSVYGHYEDK